ncbi:MAG: hypothetical protein OXF99_05790 [bacterium]|nr:hypothetical protein [bacterium]
MAGVLDRRERVVLAEDLAGVAEGTSGEVMMHTGMRWLRYWVRFDSGAERGSIHRDKLVKEAEWEDFLVERAAAEAAVAAGELVGASSSDDSDEQSESGGDDAGGDVVVNGATLPAHLLARSAAARERLGG